MLVGDLVKCIEGAAYRVDDGVGIIIQIDEYDPQSISIHVQWPEDDLWYHPEDLEVITDV